LKLSCQLKYWNWYYFVTSALYNDFSLGKQFVTSTFYNDVSLGKQCHMT
jgi:hypothetical protein